MKKCNNCKKYYDDKSINKNCPYCNDNKTILYDEEASQTIMMGKCIYCEKYYDKSINKNCPYCNDNKTIPYDKEDSQTIAIWAKGSSDLFNDDIEIGANFGRYIIEEEISSGGFSVVYRVRHKHLRYKYALKIFKNPDYNSDLDNIKKLKELFLKEASSLAKLTHPNVIKVFDVGVLNNTAYILLEYIEKTLLTDILNKIGKFSFYKTLDLLEDIASVLMEQEKQNIIHADLKPNNIFLKDNNIFCIFDYGNMNTNEIQVFTPKYASPEHYTKMLTHQSDLFQLGLLAWECLSGEKPKELTEWEYNIPPLENYRQDIPKELLKIINNLLQIKPSKRYKTAKDLLYDIREYKDYNESPIGAIRGSIFIATSYHKKFELTYKTINETAKKLNYKCIRMDKLNNSDEIWKSIALEIEYSNIMIADFTKVKWKCNINYNVITEASHARAKGKYIIIITQDSPEKLPFDWRYLPAIRYVPSKQGLEELSRKIYDKLRVFHQ